MKKALINFLKVSIPLSVGIFLIWFITKDLTQEDKENIFRSFREANYWWVGLSVALGVLSHISRAMRWNLLMEPLGYKPRLSNTFFAVMIGYISNVAFHRFGEVIRAEVLRRYEKIPMNKVFGTVITERAFDLMCLLLISIFGFIIEFENLSTFYLENIRAPLAEKLAYLGDKYISLKYVTIALAVLIGGGLLYFIFKKGEKNWFVRILLAAKGFWQGIHSIRKMAHPGAFILHTVFIWTMYYLMIYLCFFSMPEMAQQGPVIALAIFIFGSIGIIAVQGGIGAYPAIVMETLMEYGLPKTVGFAFGWLIWTAQTLMIVLLGLSSLILISVLNKKKHASR